MYFKFKLVQFGFCISRRSCAAFPLVGVVLFLSACRSVAGPDKSLAGGVLGAAWGAGAGAVVGHQLADPGPGAAIGAGFGAASGLATGIGLDVAEGTQLKQQREIDELEKRVYLNQQGIEAVQQKLDRSGAPLQSKVVPMSIYFDEARASLKLGAVRQLQELAQELRRDAAVSRIEVHGFSDETGASEVNQKLSEARARSVQNVLAQNGVPLDQIKVIGHGSAQPIANNSTAEGKQLNRRVEVVVYR